MKRMAVFFTLCGFSASLHAVPLIDNTTFATDTTGWVLSGGATLSFAVGEGDHTPAGAARVEVAQAGEASITTECIDIGSGPQGGYFVASASGRPGVGAPPGLVGTVELNYFSDPDCANGIGGAAAAEPVGDSGWARVEGAIRVPQGTQALKMILVIDDVPADTSVWFDDVNLEAGLTPNPDFSEGLEGWEASQSFVHEASEGHLTDNGALRLTTARHSIDPDIPLYVGIRSECIDIADRPVLAAYRYAASVMLDPAAQTIMTIVDVSQYTGRRCTGTVSRLSDIHPAQRGQWSRLSGEIVPEPGTRAIRVFVLGAAVGWITDNRATQMLFDDLWVHAGPPLQQLWLIGVGEINGDAIEDIRLNFTRGGAFGALFEPQNITRPEFGAARIEFDGCNTAAFSWASSLENDLVFGNGGYPLLRLAANRAAQECEAAGFDAVTGVDWMGGVWYGGAARSGEGLMVDVSADGQSAVVAWYTHAPLAGSAHSP